MQFRLHINDTPDGSVVAAELRKLADMLDGHTLTPGLMRAVHNGYAVVDGENRPRPPQPPDDDLPPSGTSWRAENREAAEK